MLKKATFKKLGLVAILAGLLTACSSAPLSQSAAPETQLGTAWGKDVSSQVVEVNNLKREQTKPNHIEVIRYSAQDPDGYGYTEDDYRLSGTHIDLAVKGKWGTYPISYSGRSGATIKGEEGKPYRLEFKNLSSDTPYEIVVSVDGVDVINGQSASVTSRGYIVYPKRTLTVEGFRKSDSEVAQFVFSKPKQSYANTNPTGASSIDNTGVIGVAVYKLYDPTAKAANAFPGDSNNSQYAQPPRR